MATVSPGRGALVQRRGVLVPLAALFFFSGISGLIYQSLWLRLLSLVFGVTIYAASTVLASFMGGLALGTMLAGRLTRRVRNPLAWFGAVEITIGIAALSTPWALGAIGHVWPLVYDRLGDHAWAITVARVLCAAAVLIVPTSLMGATLPLVVRSSLTEGALVARAVGVLYATNTAGAITGALLAGYVLVGDFGIATSFRIAAALNGIVGLSALALSRRAEASRRPAAEPAAIAGRDSRRQLVPIVFAVSGFAALALEVVWFRVLVLVVNATTYAFTTMLATVLLGIALGSALAGPLLARRWHYVRAFGMAQIATGLLTLASLAFYLHGYHAGRLRSSDHVASLFVILPPALAMGLAFPLGVRAWTGEHHERSNDSAARVATLYALNVGGAIAGSLAAGFGLLPAFGSRISVIILAAAFASAGLALLWSAASGLRQRLVAVATVLVLFVAAVRVLPNPLSAVQGQRVPPGERPLFLEEGRQTTVGVYRRPGGTVLYLDGLHQANDSYAMVTLHRQIGLLPVAIHRAPGRALVIGLGGGVTAGAVSLTDGLTMDIVELSDSVVRGAALFRHVNEDVVNRPNVRLRIDDGRNYLTTTHERYDIITADIIQPIHAGAGNLYSVEYFRLARRALAPHGVMMQWVGIRPASEYKLIVRTFLTAFPHATAWANGALLVGTTEPLQLDARAFEEKLSRPATRSALSLIDITSFESLLGQYTAGPEQLRAFLGPGLILTDDRPLVEYHRSLPPNEPPIDTGSLRDDAQRWVVR
ncbi:MAG TPA: fused MFS/spermidine synthase [Vicinamibacterales bacterium]|nr:fused MFS/spermidine synthase [Vicinamibacterales bacterium]